jgi:hypothetical protein
MSVMLLWPLMMIMFLFMYHWHCDDDEDNDVGKPERVGPADGGHQGDVCQEAGDDEEDERCRGNLAYLIKNNSKLIVLVIF